MTKAKRLTIHDIERAYDDDRWLGFGYLGERQHWLDSTEPTSPAQPERVDRADAYVLERANALGWDYEQLFDWMNSKDGRHFADGFLGFDTPAPWAKGLGPR